MRAFAAELDGAVDVLVNNAGVMALPAPDAPRTASRCSSARTTSATSRSPACCSTALSADRVVTLSSGAHRIGTIDFDDLQRERRYTRWAAYGQSKLANLLFTFELQRRLTAAGSPLRAVAAHPGYAATNLQFHTAVLPGRG